MARRSFCRTSTANPSSGKTMSQPGLPCGERRRHRSTDSFRIRARAPGVQIRQSMPVDVGRLSYTGGPDGIWIASISVLAIRERPGHR
jgi:hypothetical protein